MSNQVPACRLNFNWVTDRLRELSQLIDPELNLDHRITADQIRFYADCLKLVAARVDVLGSEDEL